MSGMPATGDPATAPPRIGLAVQSAANNRLFKEILGETYEIVDGVNAHSLDNTGIDLLVLDAPVLDQLRSALIQRRAAEQPAILPVLLAVESAQYARKHVEQELGNTVEDVLRLPTTRHELRARIGNLIRLGELSRLQRVRQQQTEAELRGVNRALHTLNRCNEVLVRVDDEQQLMQQICEVITGEGGYSLAFIASAMNDDRKSLHFHAWAGHKNDYMDGLFISWDANDQVYGTGPAGKVIREGVTVVSPNITSEAGFEAWRERALRHGLAALISLPLSGEHGPAGVLNVYSTQPGTFSKNERELLERLAQNVTYGIDALRNRQLRSQREREVRELAYSDEVTGLPNRKALSNDLDQQGDSIGVGGEGFAVLFIDLNGFKLINDALGHAEGDRVLKWVAQRLSKVVRKQDFVARQGGDEFIVLVRDASRDEDHDDEPAQQRLERISALLARRIIQTLGRPFAIGANEHRIGASIGIAISLPQPRGGSGDIDTIIDQADTAMYEAKSRHGGWAYYSNEIGERRQRRLALDSRLSGALERDEFMLHYQPLMDLADGRMVGVEALIRWPQSDGSFISPGEFIPVAEQNGLVCAIGDWVLKQAAGQVSEWQQEGICMYAAVNVSVQQLWRSGVCDHFLSLLPEGVLPESIKLEVTEDAMMSEPGRIEARLYDLWEAGFHLAIDDFGTGYSSLGRLRHIPLTSLKIDKSFIDGVPADASNRSMIETIHQLARSLGVDVVAEGIETDEQLEFLKGIACERGQGFLFGKPCTPDKLRHLLKPGAAN